MLMDCTFLSSAPLAALSTEIKGGCGDPGCMRVPGMAVVGQGGHEVVSGEWVVSRP